jgi:hypothetical protein
MTTPRVGPTKKIAVHLTAKQITEVDFYKAFNVPAMWYYSEPDDDGGVGVVAIGEDFVWSLSIARDGTCNTSEASLGDFETGIEV